MKHQITGWIAMSVPQFAEDKPRPAFFGYKPKSEYYVPIREHSFEVEVEDNFDIRPAIVAALDEKERELKANFAKAMTDIAEIRSRVLCLEMAT